MFTTRGPQDSCEISTDWVMQPTAIISFVVFIVAYVRRNSTNDLANWLLFQIVVSIVSYYHDLGNSALLR